MKTSVPQIVIFDAVGTLIAPDPPVADAYFEAGRDHGSRRTRTEVGERFREAFGGPLRGTPPAGEPHATSEATERAFWRAVVAAVFDDLTGTAAEDCFADLFDHFAEPASWRVFPDVAPTLAGLARFGLPTAVASNFDARLHGVFAGHRELAGIGRRFVSSELGWRKPDGRFFAAVCDRLGLPPAAVLYVGDEPATDVAAATTAGLPSLLIRREGPPGPGVLTDLTQVATYLPPTDAAAGA